MSYIVKKNIIELGRDLDICVSKEALPALSEAVEDMVNAAKERAEANGRKTIKARDI